MTTHRPGETITLADNLVVKYTLKKKFLFRNGRFAAQKTQTDAVQRRNSRERTRVQGINLSFEKLRHCLPTTFAGKTTRKLNKAMTLRIAADYIRHLNLQLTADHPTASNSASGILATSDENLIQTPPPPQQQESVANFLLENYTPSSCHGYVNNITTNYSNRENTWCPSWPNSLSSSMTTQRSSLDHVEEESSINRRYENYSSIDDSCQRDQRLNSTRYQVTSASESYRTEGYSERFSGEENTKCFWSSVDTPRFSNNKDNNSFSYSCNCWTPPPLIQDSIPLYDSTSCAPDVNTSAVVESSNLYFSEPPYCEYASNWY